MKINKKKDNIDTPKPKLSKSTTIGSLTTSSTDDRGSQSPYLKPPSLFDVLPAIREIDESGKETDSEARIKILDKQTSMRSDDS